MRNRSSSSSTGRLWACLKRKLKRRPKLSRRKLAEYVVRQARKPIFDLKHGGCF